MTLNAAAFVLGGLVPSGHLQEQVCFDALVQAAEGTGLSDRVIRRTVAKGIRDGIERPFEPGSES